MKTLCALVIILSLLLTSCVPHEDRSVTPVVSSISCASHEQNSSDQLNDDLYSLIDAQLPGDDYEIESIQSIYFSQEYIEESLYNGKSNVFFGYSLNDIEKSFSGDRFVFSLDESGNTTIKEFEPYDDTLEKVIRNVAIGTGVILVCVTVSIATGGLGLAAVSMVFASAAKISAITAASSAVLSSVISGAITGYRTHDFEQVKKEMALAGSQGFKTGAIIGAITGGISGAMHVHQLRHTLPSYREAELMALKKYPGTEQVSYLNGQEVSITSKGASRPDIVRVVDNHLEAIEVKRYDLLNSVDNLINKLHNQVNSRITNLPAGTTQRIVLNVQGRGYTNSFLKSVIKTIQDRLADIYPNIPVDIMGQI